MELLMRHARLFSIVLAATVVGVASNPQSLPAEQLFTVTTGNVVNVVDTANPLVVTQSGAITGLAANENVVGLDYRANGGGIYAIGSQSNVYTINPTTFAATQLGSTLSPTLEGTSFAYDFNPSAAGGILSRIISDLGDNRVIDSTTGGYFGTVEKTDVFYVSGDANDGANPNIQGIAYDTNVAGATSTQQYGIDATLAVLTTVNNNAGDLVTVGSLGGLLLAGALTDEVAFDISGDTGVAFAGLQIGTGPSQLYTIDLGTGAATLVGAFGSTVRDFTVIPQAIPEPSSVLLSSLIVGGLVCRRRRRA